jgi:hypothetical protein
MAHTISDRRREKRDAEVNAEEISRQEAVVREDLEMVEHVVEVWNSRLAAGRELFFSPTIRAAILAHTPILTFSCPAGQATGSASR